MVPGELGKAEEAFVNRARVARLATVGPGGEPHNVPICPVLHEGKVLFGTDLDTAKVRNLQRDPRCCLAFDEYTEVWPDLKQVLVFGRAEIVDSGPGYEEGRRLLYEKYLQYEQDATLEDGASAIVEVTIERVVSGL